MLWFLLTLATLFAQWDGDTVVVRNPIGHCLSLSGDGITASLPDSCGATTYVLYTGGVDAAYAAKPGRIISAQNSQGQIVEAIPIPERIVRFTMILPIVSGP